MQTRENIDIKRVIDRFDRLMNASDFEEAERHLIYWMNEAKDMGDDRSLFSVINEMTGFYRMRGDRKNAFDAVEKLKRLTSQTDKFGNIEKATAYLNCATVYNSFKEPLEALKLYEQAEKIYLENLDSNDERLAGLFNNTALAHLALKEYEKAKDYFEKAMTVLDQNTGKENEKAITCLNMADLTEEQMGPEEGEEEILKLLDKAGGYLDIACKGDYYEYKMTAEKCIPAFKHYGYFMYAMELEKRIGDGK